MTNNSVDYIKPMLATLVDKAFDDDDWLFEIKWDGYRAIAEIAEKTGIAKNNSKKIKFTSRNGQDFSQTFAPVFADLEQLKEPMVLDGEVTVVDENGRSDFQLLQNYRKFGEGNLIYYVFDILEYKGKDLRGLSLTDRKELLKKALPELQHIKYSAHIHARGKEFFKLAKAQNLEGIIAKKKDSVYQEGIRSSNWQKIKIIQQQEVVIGGYTYPEGTRKAFGSLLMGVFERGKFRYVGNTGSGFDDSSLASIKETLDKYKTDSTSFVDVPEMQNVAAWIKPKIVAEVKFQGWTESGYMRQAIFLGLREDKKAESVRREII